MFSKHSVFIVLATHTMLVSLKVIILALYDSGLVVIVLNAVSSVVIVVMFVCKNSLIILIYITL